MHNTRVNTLNLLPSEPEVSDQESGPQLKLVRSKDIIIDKPLKVTMQLLKFSVSESLNADKAFNVKTIEEGNSTKVIIQKYKRLPTHNPRKLDEIGLRRSKWLREMKLKNNFLQYLGLINMPDVNANFNNLIALNTIISGSNILNLREVMSHPDKIFLHEL